MRFYDGQIVQFSEEGHVNDARFTSMRWRVVGEPIEQLDGSLLYTTIYVEGHGSSSWRVGDKERWRDKYLEPADVGGLFDVRRDA